MSLIEELRARELARRDARRAAIQVEQQLDLTIRQQMNRVWVSFVAIIEDSVKELNGPGSEDPIALCRLDGAYAIEIIKPERRFDLVARAHLNSSTDSIDLTVFRRNGAINCPPFKSRTFHFELNQLLDLDSNSQISVHTLLRKHAASQRRFANMTQGRRFCYARRLTARRNKTGEPRN